MQIDRAGLEAWQRDQPLSILQLDPADRAVLRVAGSSEFFILYLCKVKFVHNHQEDQKITQTLNLYVDEIRLNRAPEYFKISISGNQSQTGPSDLAVVYQGMVSLGDGQALSVLVGNSLIWAK